MEKNKVPTWLYKKGHPPKLFTDPVEISEALESGYVDSPDKTEDVQPTDADVKKTERRHKKTIDEKSATTDPLSGV